MQNYLIDMDGVIVQGEELIPGADAFVDYRPTRIVESVADLERDGDPS
ncbi:MAG TPA: hypothetical protein VJJ70_06390 [Anaerolineales bacterium]|nr:hypothetical protein [Anaerolineales bacterium]